jgi:aminopeptidase N
MQEIYLKDYKKPSYLIKDVTLVFDIFDEYTVVKNTMNITKEDDESRVLVLDSIDLELLTLKLDGVELENSRYSYEDEKLTIKDTPQTFTLYIENKIYPNENTELEGLYNSGDIICTQNEPEGFRRITPYLDRPDVMSIFTTTVIADREKYPVLLSNGNKRQCHDSFDNRHGVTWHDPHPKPAYLFAVVAGDLGVVEDSFVTMNKQEVALNIYCDKGNESKCTHAMNSLKSAMKWDEEKYQREYDLEYYNIVAVDSFNMGAMENKGLNIFNSHYVLADETTATDANFMGIEAVIAHEYFHNWTGNRITCRDWFQLTLKEGLTVYRDQTFSADMNSEAIQRISDVKTLKERQFVEDASPTSHPIQPKSYISMNNFYTATVYEKGAEVIRMIHTLIGDEKFQKGMQLYFEKFDGMAVTTKDFLWAMSEASGHDLSAFELWYHQAGTPRLKVEESFKGSTYKLKLTQNITHYYPLKIALIDETTKKVIEEKTLIISKNEEEFVFENLTTQPILSINREFSAPIIIEETTTNYNFLMKYDTDSFVRYEASQLYALEVLEKYIKTKEIDEGYLKAYGILLDLEEELSYKALLLELPTISAMMQQQEIIDVEVLCKAKEDLEVTLARRYEKKLLALYHTYHDAKNSSIDSISISKRALKNRVLKLLGALKNDEVSELAYKQYQESITMTDRVVSLEVLENISEELSKKAFSDFYDKYSKDTLVMNKYFALLASSKREGVLQRVELLERDKAYDMNVPNLVRSLIGAFSRNERYFHAKDGSGYIYLANKILEIDKINAQMASSLAGAFKVYKKLSKNNKKLMEEQLKCVVSTQSISKNLFEIINKILSV